MLRPFITENLEQIAELCRKHHVLRLAVFGSAVRDDFDPARSDVDFLVEFEKTSGVYSFKNYLDLEDALAKLVGHKVDLVMSGAVKPRFRMLISEDEEALYAA